MSLALAAIVLLWVATPGIIARRAYLSFPFAKRYSASSVSDEVIWAVLPAVALHSIALSVVQSWDLGYRASFGDLGLLLMGPKTDLETAALFSRVGTNLWPMVVYQAAVCALGAASGWLARGTVVRAAWDRSRPNLRFSNEWFYLLTGRHWGYVQGTDFDFVWLDALVGKGADTMIYSGLFEHYVLSRDGGLEFLCLREVTRIELKPAAAGAPAAAPTLIPGEAFILKYSEVVNLNLTFYKRAAPPVPAAPPPAASTTPPSPSLAPVNRDSASGPRP